MKRSKMLKKIYKICKAWQDSKIEKRITEEVLSMIEKEGMLPPHSTLYIDSPVGKTTCIPCNLWDEE